MSALPIEVYPEPASGDRYAILRELERKVLWLSSWMIHQANHERASRDGLKVGGHQASSASCATIMTALYFSVLRPQDRVAVKPHASPIYHAILRADTGGRHRRRAAGRRSGPHMPARRLGRRGEEAAVGAEDRLASSQGCRPPR